jgi:hypothetical protein
VSVWVAGHAPTRITVTKIPAGVPEEAQGHTSTSQTGVAPDVMQKTYPLP